MTIELSDALGLSQIDTPKRQTRQEKTDQLVRLIFQGHKSFSEIAKEIGISRRTAYRYWNRWKRSEEAQQVDWEWWALYMRVREKNPEKALECLTRIKHRMTKEEVEVNQNIKQIELVYHVTKTDKQIRAARGTT